MTIDKNEVVFYGLPADAVQHGPFRLRSIVLDKNGEPTMIGELWADFPNARDGETLRRQFNKDRKMKKFLKPRTMQVSVCRGQYGIGFGVTVRGEIDNPSAEFLAMAADAFAMRTTIELNSLKKKREEIEADEARIKAFVNVVTPALNPTGDYAI